MSPNPKNKVSTAMVVFAFAIVYLVWGSTYYYIKIAIEQIPAMMMAFFRFTTAGLLLLTWCLIKGDRLFVWKDMKPAIISGLLLLFIGNGAVVWAEQYLPSSFVAVLAAATPIWFVVLDKPNWHQNLKSKGTIIGLASGFIGVILLFSEKGSRGFSSADNSIQTIALVVLVAGAISWAGGSLYSKYKSSGPSHTVNTAWQMISAGISFIPVSLLSGEWKEFHWQEVGPHSWFALLYLIGMGSLAGYSAYVWLLQVRPATQVSTNAYVNPVVAVLLGVYLAKEKMSWLQVAGLAVILTSVLLVNLAKYRKSREPMEIS